MKENTIKADDLEDMRVSPGPKGPMDSPSCDLAQETLVFGLHLVLPTLILDSLLSFQEGSFSEPNTLFVQVPSCAEELETGTTEPGEMANTVKQLVDHKPEARCH